jgi:hypothetical protein
MRRVRLAAALLALSAGTAFAQSESFRVDGLPPGDTLSIREGPDADAPAVGGASGAPTTPRAG